ncbi:MAG: flagellar hook-length control protein FliK [Woeseiaceae bacterium]
MPATAGTAAPPSVGAVPDIAERPGSAGWGDALGDRVVWMTAHKFHNAEIRLNPADLGPVRVQISVDDGTASINFHAHHPVTRDAIEQALPRLRDMLVEQGLTLGHTSVSDQGVSHQHSQAGRHGSVSATLTGDDERIVHAEAVLAANPAAVATGLVDLFA